MGDVTESEQRKREGVFTLYYYIALVALAVTVLWHWVFGDKYGFFGTVAVWSVLIFIALGLLNSLGVFGRR